MLMYFNLLKLIERCSMKKIVLFDPGVGFLNKGYEY